MTEPLRDGAAYLIDVVDIAVRGISLRNRTDAFG
jgi:hypothetical protein